MTFPILNAEQARFECTFGRGCEGLCCRNGRPMVYPEEAARIEPHLEELLPELRPEACEAVRKQGYLSRRRKSGQPMVRVVKGWCIFFNGGCVLHRLGAREGDAYRYKPWVCSVFPISRDGRGRWYVRQKGLFGEIWDLPCLDPPVSTVSARDSLQAEIALVERFEKDEQAGER
jgi:Fe-S-cluster containining protein